MLQEVDHHHDWMSPMLAKAGYRSLFVKKPRAPGLAFDSTLEDGCSLFYRVTASVEPFAGGAKDRGEEKQEAERTDKISTATVTRTVLDLLDTHTCTYAVEEPASDNSDCDHTGVGERMRGEEGGSNNNPRARPGRNVIQNQVAAIALLRVSTITTTNSSSRKGGSGCCSAVKEASSGDEAELEREEGSLIILATTHLKASKDEYGEVMRARQVTIHKHTAVLIECATGVALSK